MADKTGFVTGDSSQAETWLMPELVADGWRIHLISRGTLERTDHGPLARWHSADLSDPSAELPETTGATLFHTAGIWLLIPWIEKFHARGMRRIIPFISTSRFTKKDSASNYEQDVVDRLECGEAVATERCAVVGIALTLLRPTLIYGGKIGNGRSWTSAG